MGEAFEAKSRLEIQILKGIIANQWSPVKDEIIKPSNLKWSDHIIFLFMVFSSPFLESNGSQENFILYF